MIHCNCNNFNTSSVRAGITELANYLGEAFANQQPGYLANTVDRACREERSAVDVYEQGFRQEENRPGCGRCLRPLADMIQAYQNGDSAHYDPGKSAYSADRHSLRPAPENRL